MISSEVTSLNQQLEAQRQQRELAAKQAELEQRQVELAGKQASEAARQTELQQRFTDDFQGSMDKLAEQLKRVEETLGRGSTGRLASAGGLALDSARADGRASGHPWATGDVKLVQASQNVPEGWLPCIGGYIQRVSYPELYAVIGERYGSTSQDNFKLPGAADLPTIPSSNMRWLIRL